MLDILHVSLWLFVFVTVFIAGRTIYGMLLKQKAIKERKVAVEMSKVILESCTKFGAWRRVRPFLHVGQCPYMQSLIWTEIRSLEYWKKFAPSFWKAIDETYLAGLYELLSTPPPPKPKGIVAFYFICSIQQNNPVVHIHAANRTDEICSVGTLVDRHQRFCFAHFDGDTYQSTQEFLNFFYPRLVSGGRLVFDDFGSIATPGVAHAVEDFFGKRKHLQVLPTQQAIFVKN